MSEHSLYDDVERAIQFYEQANHHAAARTRQMIETLGEEKALSRLMISGDPQQGFRILRDNNQLDKSFEAVVLRHQDHFEQHVIEAARWRIENAHQLDEVSGRNG